MLLIPKNDKSYNQQEKTVPKNLDLKWGVLEQLPNKISNYTLNTGCCNIAEYIINVCELGMSSLYARRSQRSM